MDDNRVMLERCGIVEYRVQQLEVSGSAHSEFADDVVALTAGVFRPSIFELEYPLCFVTEWHQLILIGTTDRFN